MTQVRFVRQLDDGEVRTLEIMRRTAVGRVSQRAHMVLLSNRRYCIAEIARVFDASENTVRQWIERYERDGVDCLDNRPRSGRPPKVSAAVQPAIHEDVHKARSVQAWLASHTRVKLYFLPCYMPQLNPVEKVWWHMKAVVTANRLYGSMAALVDAINAFFERLSPSRVQTLAG